jgi:hypothetical protein
MDIGHSQTRYNSDIRVTHLGELELVHAIRSLEGLSSSHCLTGSFPASHLGQQGETIAAPVGLGWTTAKVLPLQPRHCCSLALFWPVDRSARRFAAPVNASHPQTASPASATFPVLAGLQNRHGVLGSGMRMAWGMVSGYLPPWSGASNYKPFHSSAGLAGACAAAATEIDASTLQAFPHGPSEREYRRAKT